MHKKSNRFLFSWFQLTAIIIFSGCQPRETKFILNSDPNLLVIYGPKEFAKETIIDQDVILYPGAKLKTSGSGKVIFNKKVTVIGESQVFDEDAKVEFAGGTISALNPCWFGARGDDELDDTKVIQKVLDLARVYKSSINVEFSVGRYLINKTLEVGNDQPSGKSINIIGKSVSASSLSGSSLQWIGPEEGVLMHLQNYCTSSIENMDFAKGEDRLLKYNIDLSPISYQILFRNCSFSGASGPGSANVNLNKGNNLQVSEVSFENCTFRGYSPDTKSWTTESAVVGGLANTKDFVFRFCSLLGYNTAAINIHTTDMLLIQGCTFSTNQLDIFCSACNTLAESNYSENSRAFFSSASSYGVAFTTLMNNTFYGHSEEDYVIPYGSGSLVMINNNFGGMGGEDKINKIRWDSGIWDNVFSIGNFYRNALPIRFPFEFTGQQEKLPLQSSGDLIGRTADDISEVKMDTVHHQDR